MPEAKSNDLVVQEAALKAWEVVFSSITRLIGDQLSTAQLHRIEGLKTQFVEFWMREPGPHHEEDLEIVKARINHLVADAMLDASQALVATLQKVLEIALEIAASLIQRLLKI